MGIVWRIVSGKDVRNDYRMGDMQFFMESSVKSMYNNSL